jgi:hypothetical protein
MYHCFMHLGSNTRTYVKIYPVQCETRAVTVFVIVDVQQNVGQRMCTYAYVYEVRLSIQIKLLWRMRMTVKPEATCGLY